MNKINERISINELRAKEQEKDIRKMDQTNKILQEQIDQLTLRVMKMDGELKEAKEHLKVLQNKRKKG